MTETKGRYFDDLHVGDRFATSSRTVKPEDVAAFEGLIRTKNRMFSSDEHARQHGIFARSVVPGLLTQIFAMGLTIEKRVIGDMAIALMGTQLRILAPLYVGDTMQCEVEVSSKKKASKHDRGVVTLLTTTTNQDAQPVQSFTSTFMVWRRPELVAAEE